jgi:hypothetical protein
VEKLPFDLTGRHVIEGGTLLFFRCHACAGESIVFLRNDDPLHGRYPLACACGVHVTIHFGSAWLGKKLLRALRHLGEAPPDAPPEPYSAFN